MWEQRAKYRSTVDGDTVDMEVVDLGYGILLWHSADRKLRYRLLGVDTPERGEFGYILAGDIVRAWFARLPAVEWPVVVNSYKPMADDSFGRWLGKIWNADKTECLNDLLREHGWKDLKHPYQ
jgi:endonuclease YncB( thermonuclease family)